MASTSRQTLQARYHAGEVILSGPSDTVHSEADRIMRQFAASAAPFRIVRDNGDYMVLRRSR